MLEVLISSGLLLGLSAILFAGVVPAMKREDWFTRHQTDVRSFLIARERLTTELRPVQLLDTPPFTQGNDTILLEYYRPVESDSDAGTVATVDLNEVVLYDETVTFQLALSDKGILYFRNSVAGGLAPIWNLGPDATADVTLAPDLRQLELQFQGPLNDRYSTKATWEHKLMVVLR